MGVQEKMSGPNGSAAASPRSIGKNVSELLHDFIALMELQVDLFKIDLRETVPPMRLPIAMLLGAGVAIVGTFPVALTFFAELLVAGGGLSRTLAFLIATLLGLLIAGGLGVGGWLSLRRGIRVFERSGEEFTRNVNWIKRVLTSSVPSAGQEGRKDRPDFT